MFPNMPKLIVVGGVPAAGKSTLAKYLASRTGIDRISMDDLKESLFNVAGARDREWSKSIGRLAWPVFQGMVEMHLSRGDNVIAEAIFLWPGDTEWIHQTATQYNARIYQIWMTADPVVVRERFIDRANSDERHPGHCDALEHVIAEFDERLFHRAFDPLSLNGKTITVDTTDFDRVNFETICSFLDV